MPLFSQSLDSHTHYLNADLELLCAADLTPIASFFSQQEISQLHFSFLEKHSEQHPRLCFATFEANDSFETPAETIEVLLSAIASLPSDLESLWRQCEQRILDIGYQCGSEPWAFNQSLPNDMLARIAAAGLTLRLTLYPMATNQQTADGKA
jgi:hypothetical protein